MFAELGQFSLQSANSYLVHETNYEDCIFRQLNLYLPKIHLKSMSLVIYCQSVRNRVSLKWSGHRINGIDLLRALALCIKDCLSYHTGNRNSCGYMK